MKSLNASRVAGKRAISALLTAAVITSGTTVIAASTASAIEAPESGVSVTGVKPKGEIGQGELETTAPSVQPGGILELKGTGYAERGATGFTSFRINDNVAAQWPEQAGQGGNAEGKEGTVDLPQAAVAGQFMFSVIEIPGYLLEFHGKHAVHGAKIFRCWIESRLGSELRGLDEHMSQPIRMGLHRGAVMHSARHDHGLNLGASQQRSNQPQSSRTAASRSRPGHTPPPFSQRCGLSMGCRC